MDDRSIWSENARRVDDDRRARIARRVGYVLMILALAAYFIAPLVREAISTALQGNPY